MIGLFGGSFDPIHHGHLIVGRAVMEALPLDEVRFMPARGQPFKQGRHGAAPEHRGEMVRLAVAGERGFSRDTTELSGPEVSYTVDTLRRLRRDEPTRRFALLIGADAAAEFADWRESAAIPGLAEVVVFGRPGGPEPVGSFVRHRVAVPAVDISATAIRTRVAAGLSIRYLVPDAVAEYIAAHGLYRDGSA